MKPSKNRCLKQREIIKKYEGQTLLPLTYMYARYGRMVVDTAVKDEVITPSVIAPKAVLFHAEKVSAFDRALAASATAITIKQESRG